MAPQALWYMRVEHTDTDPAEQSLVGVAGNEYPDGSFIDLSGHGPWPLTSPRVMRVRYRADDRQIQRITITRDWAPAAPPMLFVEVPGPPGVEPSTINLVAFVAAAPDVGRLFTADGYAGLGRSADGQAGAIEWEPVSGLIRQVYVDPDRRRQGIGTALVLGAAAVRTVRGWPALHGDGQRTDLGEAWIRGGPAQWQHRVPDRTAVPPPMTPGER